MPSRRVTTPRETFDDPWKQIVPALFESFLAFFAPEAAAQIDWQHARQFLDKELRRVAKGLSKRRGAADFLVKVWRKEGEEQWLLIHIELQAQKDLLFPERLLDWIMSLPEALEDRFDAEWQVWEREQTMAQTMPPILRRAQARGEAIGIEIGEQKGKRDTLLRLMEIKFGPLPADVRARIEQISEIEQLDRLIAAVLSAATLAEMPLPG